MTRETINEATFTSRMLAMCVRGGLTGLPRKRADLGILLKSIALGFGRGRVYSQSDCDMVVKSWLATIAPSLETDHVTMRRYLVDEGFLHRERGGTEYWLSDDPPIAFDFATAIDSLDVATLVVQSRAAQAQRRHDRVPDGLDFRKDYFADRTSREAFKRFLRTIHGVNLNDWERYGYWSRDYVAFSLFDGGEVAASVCVMSSDAVVDGRSCRLAQLSGVGTLPQYRRRGLNRWLTEQAIAFAKDAHDGMFLFADDDAVPFYQKCGFVPVAERAPLVELDAISVARNAPRGLVRRLDPLNERDRDLIFRIASERIPVSDVFGVRDAALLMFHCLTSLPNHIYYVEDLETIILCRPAAQRLILFDVVSREPIDYEDLVAYLNVFLPREIWFHFVPDKFGLAPTQWKELPGNNLHILPPLQMPARDFVVPYTAHA